MLLLVAWEVAAASGKMPSMSFPRMSAVLATWWELIISGELFGELVPSLWRMFAGYFIGVALGVMLGLLMGYFRFFYSLLEPITEVLRPIPSPGLPADRHSVSRHRRRDEDFHDLVCVAVPGAAQHL